MPKQNQCPSCHDFIEFDQGCAYIFLCDEIYSKSASEGYYELYDEIDNYLFPK